MKKSMEQKKKWTSVQKLPRYFSPLSLLLSWRGLHTNVVVYHLQKKESKSTSSFSFPIICLLQNVIYWIIKRATFGIKRSQPTIGNHELIWLARLKPTDQ